MSGRLKAEGVARIDGLGTTLDAGDGRVKIGDDKFVFAVLAADLAEALQVREHVIILGEQQIDADDEFLGVEGKLAEVEVELHIGGEALEVEA